MSDKQPNHKDVATALSQIYGLDFQYEKRLGGGVYCVSFDTIPQEGVFLSIAQNILKTYGSTDNIRKSGSTLAGELVKFVASCITGRVGCNEFVYTTLEPNPIVGSPLFGVASNSSVRFDDSSKKFLGGSIELLAHGTVEAMSSGNEVDGNAVVDFAEAKCVENYIPPFVGMGMKRYIGSDKPTEKKVAEALAKITGISGFEYQERDCENRNWEGYVAIIPGEIITEFAKTKLKGSSRISDILNGIIKDTPLNSCDVSLHMTSMEPPYSYQLHVRTGGNLPIGEKPYCKERDIIKMANTIGGDYYPPILTSVGRVAIDGCRAHWDEATKLRLSARCLSANGEAST